MVDLPSINTKDAAFTAANLATNALGKAANPATVALDMIRNDYDMSDAAIAAAKASGHSEATAVKDSPAYKRFVSEMYERQPNQTLIKSIAAISGGLLGGMLLAALPFGAVIGAIGGGLLGNYLADQFLDSKHFDYESFASGLEAQSQNHALNGEQTFVALLLNMENKAELKAVLNTYGIAKKADLVEALDTNPALVTRMMHEQDGLIRDSYNIKTTSLQNPQTGYPIATSEMLAVYYNSPAAVDYVTGLKGANLLSEVSVGDAVLQLNSRLTQIEQMQQPNVMQAQVPNVPNLRGATLHK